MCTSIRMKMLIYKVRYNTHICVHHTLFQVFSLTVVPFRRSNHISTFLRFIEYTCLAFASIEVLFYTVEPRLCSYAIFAKCRFIHSKDVDAYILLKPYTSSTFNHIPHRHYEQIMQIFYPQHLVFMYLSSPRQVYSTDKLRSRNRHFSRYFHDSTNRSKVALIFTGDSVLNRTLAEQVISSWIFDVFII